MTLSQGKFCPLGNTDWVMCGDSLGGGGGNIVLAIDLVGEVRGAAHSVYGSEDRIIYPEMLLVPELRHFA